MKLSWDEETNSLTDGRGTTYHTNPTTGLAWSSKGEAMLWLESQESVDPEPVYLGYVGFTSIGVVEGTGLEISTPEGALDFAETTVTVGSTLRIEADILAVKDDHSTVLTELPDDLFRIPIVNIDTGERDLFLGSLVAGKLTIEAPMTQVGYWEVNENLVNSKLPYEQLLGLDTTVFVVARVPAQV